MPQFGWPGLTHAFVARQTLRQEWGFDGYVTADCDAVGDIYQPFPSGHAYASPPNGSALALKAGTDLDCGYWGARAYVNELPIALQQGLVAEEELDRSLVRLTALQMELGLFDPKVRRACEG